jgi:L-Ala-D/L-Glu epimerase
MSMRIASLELFAVDLRLRKRFAHAAAERSRSESVFLKCVTDTGAIGFGESLPRKYVTGESRDDAFDLLRDSVLPRLRGMSFDSMAEVETFLRECDGHAPREWVDADSLHGAAWCCVDLALLDAFGRAFETRPLESAAPGLADDFRYSGVLSAGNRLKLARDELRQSLYGLREIKMKVSRTTDDDTIRWACRLRGPWVDLRVDVNMDWTRDEALERIPVWSRLGITSFEQPLAAGDIEGMQLLCAKTNACVVADESFTTRESLERLIAQRACRAVNARISKCGGLVATLARCKEAFEAGLEVQLGCQVGESSLLSAAQLRLAAALERVSHAEGCFGLHLLRADPVAPLLQFRFAGRPPDLPPGPGFGITVDEQALGRFTTRRTLAGR